VADTAQFDALDEASIDDMPTTSWQRQVASMSRST
jgi:hypothetical protein